MGVSLGKEVDIGRCVRELIPVEMVPRGADTVLHMSMLKEMHGRQQTLPLALTGRHVASQL